MNIKSILALLTTSFALCFGAAAGTVHDDTVLANHTDVYTLTFEAGVEARILVIGDGDTDLDLFIYDENGNLIDSDEDDTDRCVASVTPKWTGKFTVKIKNWGDVYNDYRLLID